MDGNGPQPPVRCRPDCRYYSTYTGTCDYMLIMYRPRGCPSEACTRYARQTFPRPARKIPYDPEDWLYFAPKEGMALKYALQARPETQDVPKRFVADCGHEVCEGEDVFEWEGGQTLCSECLEERFGELSLIERAELLGCGHWTVGSPNGGGR